MSSFKARPHPRACTDPLSQYCSPLVGLELLEKKSRRRYPSPEMASKENHLPNGPSRSSEFESPTKKRRAEPPILHSARRAKDRAMYEVQRASHERARCKNIKEQRKSLLQETEQQLKALRKKL
mmetsp:Transcript_27777/g.41083  ORF Transcript_27777/g.41083 Transcript_27777/m.41083 type:complete len:124 (+) Transcript_27777:3-374(+)